jgi:hypothetical protein
VYALLVHVAEVVAEEVESAMVTLDPLAEQVPVNFLSHPTWLFTKKPSIATLELMVRTNAVLEVRVPSVAVMVIVGATILSVSGVMVAVQLGAVPLQTTFAFGTVVVLLELMLR